MARTAHTVFISVSALSLLLSSIVLLTQERSQDVASMFTAVLPVLAVSVLAVVIVRRYQAKSSTGGG